jgi:hypothetical protein
MATFPFWSKEIDEVTQSLNSSTNGLSKKRRAGNSATRRV